MTVNLEDYATCMKMAAPEVVETLEATFHDAARVMSPAGLHDYMEGAKGLCNLGRGHDVVLSFLEEMPAVVQECGEDIIRDCVEAALKLSSMTSGQVIALLFAVSPQTALVLLVLLPLLGSVLVAGTRNVRGPFAIVQLAWLLLLAVGAPQALLDLRFPGSRLLGEDAGWQLRLHVLTSMLAYSLLTLASAQAILLAVQDNHLRRHHPGGFIRALPPLQTMESLLFEMIGVGFALLSVALVTGFIYLEDMFAQHLVHKTVLSIAAWCAFAVLLWGRWRFGWRGRTAIRWTLGGFIALMLAFFGSKHTMSAPEILEIVHTKIF